MMGHSGNHQQHQNGEGGEETPVLRPRICDKTLPSALYAQIVCWNVETATKGGLLEGVLYYGDETK